MLLSSGNGLTHGIEYLEEVLFIYEAEGYHKGWKGDQFAVSKSIEGLPINYSKRERQQVEMPLLRRNGGISSNSVKLLLVHVNEMQYTPKSGCQINHNLYSLHFKGPEKKKLADSWQLVSRLHNLTPWLTKAILVHIRRRRILMSHTKPIWNCHCS